MSSNSISPGRTYIQVLRVLINQGSTSTNVLDCNINVEGQGQIATSGNDNRESRRSSSTYGQQFFYIGQFTSETVAEGWGVDGDMQFQLRSDGSTTVYQKHLISLYFEIVQFGHLLQRLSS